MTVVVVMRRAVIVSVAVGVVHTLNLPQRGRLFAGCPKATGWADEVADTSSGLVRGDTSIHLKEFIMGSAHTPADNLVYDLVSIQYHSLKAAALYDKYAQDAVGHDDVLDFIRECQEQDAERAVRCHKMLIELTKDGLDGN